MSETTIFDFDPAAGCASGGCGSQSATVSGSGLSPELLERVRSHPCYSEKAHHHFARMHVAVAPACNIQCHYCNRKYDCSNESRPGVVSEVLSPQQAVRKVKAVATAIPQMSVVGIAGPGDSLANPERTFETLRLLAEETPDLQLCLSTNGLNLPGLVDRLSQYRISHVTVTINALDGEIGAKIYPWIFWKNRRIRGRKGAEILIEQQLEGVERLAGRGVLVKVNSVMIPGVNDRHLYEVNREIKRRGAFLHNIMPLIAEPEHGTYYGVTGQRSPDEKELQQLQDACAGDMQMMRHCRQCRADAVGLLGEDLSADFSLDNLSAEEVDYRSSMAMRAGVQRQLLEKMDGQPSVGESRVEVINLDRLREKLPGQRTVRPVIMAVATAGGGVINQHFGYAREFLVYEASESGVRLIGTRRTDNYCSGPSECSDEGEGRMERIVGTLDGCEVLLCSRIGIDPWHALEAASIRPVVDYAMQGIEAAVAAEYQRMVGAGELARGDGRERRSLSDSG